MADASAARSSPPIRRTASYRALSTPSRSSSAGAATCLREPPPPPTEDRPRRHFLDACSLCHVPLRASRDVFMYKGDVPFCSEECRQEQIALDEAMERDAVSRRRLCRRPTFPSAAKQPTTVAGGSPRRPPAAEAVVAT